MALYLAFFCAVTVGLSAQEQSTGLTNLSPESLQGWLTYLSSDELEGRATFSEGLGLAAAYIAQQLKEAGVKPGGDRGSYFQRVSVLGVNSTNRSTVTVEVNGQTRTFFNGEGVAFPDNVGGKRTVAFDRVEFVGYGLNLGPAHNDYKDIDVKGKAVVWMGNNGPKSADPPRLRQLLRGRADVVIQDLGAGAAIAPPPEIAAGGRRGGRGGSFGNPNFTTVKRLDSPEIPGVTSSHEFLEFLFSAADVKYADLRAKAEAQEELPRFTLKNVKLTFNLDADYQVVNTRYTRNVVGIVEGADPRLKDTYVAFGAHYDHVGYQQGILSNGNTDRISNGADDDGSGTATLIGLARAFAQGPKPRRSLVFVWHAGEETGLWGSEYFADYPAVPIDKIIAQLNMDMIGRTRDNNESYANSVLVVGSDRISSELHNIMVDANASLPRALTLDYEMNDPLDPERIYYRSDHYSYAAKGIPIIFFFTGLHPDYHEVSDSVDKINFVKMSRIGRLVYETGLRVANLDHAPMRDFKGPRMGKGASGKFN
jgi:hypothetical protein